MSGIRSASKNAQARALPVHILDDLSSKFLINLPEAEKNDLIRLFFQIELAHWFFLDFYCTQEENAIFVCGIKQFAQSIFQHIPSLNHHIPNLTTILDEWRSYKTSVPTYGTILLTPDMKSCLLVQSFFAKNSWSFPKGKVNENEDPVKCAIREVYEETGFDSSHLIDEKAFVEGHTSNYQYTRLYIVKNVPADTKFCPRTRNEIKDCSWFTIDELPNSRYDDGYFLDQKKIRANSFYMILPFISKLKHWIANERLAKVMGNKKKQGRGANVKHQNGKKAFHKTANGSSPFFFNLNGNGEHHNNNNNQQQHQKNTRSRHKSCGDFLESPNILNNTLKVQNTSTPINTHNNSPLVPSSSSAFRATNNLSNSFKKQNLSQHSKISNGNTNGSQDHTKRKLFASSSDVKENVAPIKPFQFDIPECWKNFKFDRKKIVNSIYNC